MLALGGRLRLAARELACGFHHDFGVIALYVVPAVVDPHMICCREVGGYFILKPRGHGARGGRLAGRPARARQDYGWDTRGDWTGMNLFAGVEAVIDFPTHDPRHEQRDGRARV